VSLATSPRIAALVLSIWPLAVGCLEAEDRQAPASESPQVGGLAARHDFERRTARFDLPGRLDEVSGLAVTPDGRLFAHDDERALVHEIDPAQGTVGKRFSAGDPPVRGDFEGIAIVGERFFLVTSGGLLYELREADDRRESPYRVTDTGLGAQCEVEGLDYDAAHEALLFACKVTRPERGVLTIHRLPLDPARGSLPPIEVPRATLAEHGIDVAFAPSAIAVDPTGSLILVSAPVESLIEIDQSGNVLAGVRLSRDRHPQPEGLAFGPDGTLYITDERNGQPARVSAYARLGQGGGQP
jgi:uncharacterized protein YjiK